MFGLTGCNPYMFNYNFNPFYGIMNYNLYRQNCRCNSFFNNMGYSYPFISNYSYNPMYCSSMNYNQYQGSNSIFWNQGYIDGRKQRISNIANQSMQTLYQSQTELLTLINSSELTDAQKNKIYNYMQTIQKIQTELLQVMSQSQIVATKYEADLINNKVEALSSITRQLMQKITEMPTIFINEEEEEDPIDPTEDEDPVTPDDDDEVVDDSDDSEVKKPPVSDETHEEEQAEIEITDPISTHMQVSQDVQDIVKDIYVATKGLGTDNEKLNDAIGKIDKDNVLEVFSHWNETHLNSFSSYDENGLIETIYDEYPNSHFSWIFGESQCHKNLKNIYNALKAKADEIAKTHTEIKQSVNQYQAQIEYGLSHEFRADEDEVAKAFNAMVNILTAYSSQA